jgi:hypothetical protein
VNGSGIIGGKVRAKVSEIEGKAAAGAFRASNELRNAALDILSGSRNGRTYRIPYSKATYTASAPGSPPAVRTGVFRLSWNPKAHSEKHGKKMFVVASIESKVKVGPYILGDLLEGGTRKMAARPYKEKIRDKALPKIKSIFSALLK